MSISTTAPALAEDRVDLFATTFAPPRRRWGSRALGCLSNQLPGSFRIAIIGDPYLGPALDRRKGRARSWKFVSKNARDAVRLENVLDVRYRRQSSISVDADHLGAPCVRPNDLRAHRRPHTLVAHPD